MTFTHALARFTHRLGRELDQMVSQKNPGSGGYTPAPAGSPTYTRGSTNNYGQPPLGKHLFSGAREDVVELARRGALVARSIHKALTHQQVRAATQDLRAAVSSGNRAGVHGPLKDGAYVNRPNKYGRTIGHLVAELSDMNGSYEMAQLIFLGPDIYGNNVDFNAHDREGNTPLGTAAMRDNLGFFNGLILALRANPGIHVDLSAENHNGLRAAEMTDNPNILRAINEIAELTGQPHGRRTGARIDVHSREVEQPRQTVELTTRFPRASPASQIQLQPQPQPHPPQREETLPAQRWYPQPQTHELPRELPREQQRAQPGARLREPLQQPQHEEWPAPPPPLHAEKTQRFTQYEDWAAPPAPSHPVDRQRFERHEERAGRNPQTGLAGSHIQHHSRQVYRSTREFLPHPVGTFAPRSYTNEDSYH